MASTDDSMSSRELSRIYDNFEAISDHHLDLAGDAAAVGDAPPRQHTEETSADAAVKELSTAPLTEPDGRLAASWRRARFVRVQRRLARMWTASAAYWALGVVPRWPLPVWYKAFLTSLALTEVALYTSPLQEGLGLADDQVVEKLFAGVVAGAFVPVGHLLGTRVRGLARDDRQLNRWLACYGGLVLLAVWVAAGAARSGGLGYLSWSAYVFGAIPPVAALFLSANMAEPEPQEIIARLHARASALCAEVSDLAERMWSNEPARAARQRALAAGMINGIRARMPGAFGVNPFLLEPLTWVSRLGDRADFITSWDDWVELEGEEIARLRRRRADATGDRHVEPPAETAAPASSGPAAGDGGGGLSLVPIELAAATSNPAETGEVAR